MATVLVTLGPLYQRSQRSMFEGTVAGIASKTESAGFGSIIGAGDIGQSSACIRFSGLGMGLRRWVAPANADKLNLERKPRNETARQQMRLFRGILPDWIVRPNRRRIRIFVLWPFCARGFLHISRPKARGVVGCGLGICDGEDHGSFLVLGSKSEVVVPDINARNAHSPNCGGELGMLLRTTPAHSTPSIT